MGIVWLRTTELVVGHWRREGARRQVLRLSASTDITNLFGQEVGNFTVSLTVKNAFQPYDWDETWVVRLP